MTLVAIWGSINSFPKISLDSHFYESPFSKATIFSNGLKSSVGYVLSKRFEKFSS